MRVRLAGAFLGFAVAAAFLLPDVLAARVPARGDLPDFFWPMKAHTMERWRSGSPPLWNPLSGCGEPWLAQLQTGVFDPGDAPFLLPWPFGPPAAIVLHLVIAAAGMASWLSALGRSRLAALSGAAVYASGGVFLSLVPVYNNFATAAFLPWIFLGAFRAIRGEGMATFAAASALAFLGGEPALAVGGSLAAAAVALAPRRPGGTNDPGRRAGLRLLGGLLLSAGLTAAVALPFAIHLRESRRLTGATREEALGRPVGPSDLADLLWPPPPELTRSGVPGRGTYLATLALGPLPLLLAAAGVTAWGDRRATALLVAVAGLGLLLSLGAWGGIAPLLWSAGLLRGVRFPARWFALTHVALAVLAGTGVDVWRGEETRHRRRALLAAAPFAAVALLGIAAVDPGRLRGDGAARALLASAAAAAGLALLRRRPSGEVAFLAVLAGPLVWFSSEALASAPAAALVRTPLVVSGLKPSDPGRLFVAAHDAHLLARWLAGGGRGFSEETVRRQHEALAGYGNLRLGLATAGTASPIDSPRRARLLGAALAGGSAGALFALADVRRVVTPFPTTIPGAAPEAFAGGVRRYELARGLGRVFFPREVRAADDDAVFEALRRPDLDPEEVAWVTSAPVPLPPRRSAHGFSLARVVRDEPERAEIAISTSDPGLVVLTRSFDSGWRLVLDGTRVSALRVDLAFLGAFVPAGDHKLELIYEPGGYRVGLALSGASLVLLAALVLAGHAPVRSGP
jgi:hypothetical protein